MINGNSDIQPVAPETKLMLKYMKRLRRWYLLFIPVVSTFTAIFLIMFTFMGVTTFGRYSLNDYGNISNTKGMLILGSLVAYLCLLFAILYIRSHVLADKINNLTAKLGDDSVEKEALKQFPPVKFSLSAYLLGTASATALLVVILWNWMNIMGTGKVSDDIYGVLGVIAIVLTIIGIVLDIFEISQSAKVDASNTSGDKVDEYLKNSSTDSLSTPTRSSTPLPIQQATYMTAEAFWAGTYQVQDKYTNQITQQLNMNWYLESLTLDKLTTADDYEPYLQELLDKHLTSYIAFPQGIDDKVYQLWADNRYGVAKLIYLLKLLNYFDSNYYEHDDELADPLKTVSYLNLQDAIGAFGNYSQVEAVIKGLTDPKTLEALVRDVKPDLLGQLIEVLQSTALKYLSLNGSYVKSQLLEHEAQLREKAQALSDDLNF